MPTDPLTSDWTSEQAAVMERLRDWAASYTELNQHLAAWMQLPSTDANALGHIVWAAEEGLPLSPAVLARRIGLTTGATTALLNRLEGAGHAERSREHADRRRVTLRPTPAAREQTRAFLAAAGTEIAVVVAETSPEELLCITKFLSRVTAASEQGNTRLRWAYPA